MAKTFTLPKLLMLVVALLATLTLASPAAKAKCAKGAHIIAIRGHPPLNSNGTQPQGGYGITLPLLDAIKGQIPHSTNESIPYPKNAPGDKENLVALKNLKAAIAKSVSNCPKTPIVLMGYSNGAFILMNGVCGTMNAFLTSTPPIAKKYAKNIISTVVYSDGSWVPGQPWDHGGCNRPGSFPRTNNAKCKPFAPTIQSYCVGKDDYCCAAGGNHKSHYVYFKKYDKSVAKKCAQQFKAFKSK